MGLISQMPDLNCPEDIFDLTADSCRDDIGVIQGIAVMKDAGTSPFSTTADFATALNWTTAQALAATDPSALRTLALEVITSTFTGGDANTVDYPDSTSGLERVVSYAADQFEINILQPSATMESELRKLSALQNIEDLRVWFVTDKNVMFGPPAGFKATMISYVAATRGARTTNDNSMLMFKFRRVPSADDITYVDSSSLDLSTIL
jgi:hypothetical protein